MARSKSAKHRKIARDAIAPEATPVALKVGSHKFRIFTGLDAAFGASDRDYPAYESIPEEFRRSSVYERAFSGLFFKGGRLEDHGLRLRSGVDRASFFTTMRALMASFAPKHEVKQATVAWLLAEHCDAIAKAEGSNA